MVILDYKETHLNFLYDDLLGEYGEKQAKLLYSLMCQKYTDIQMFPCSRNADLAREKTAVMAAIGVGSAINRGLQILK